MIVELTYINPSTHVEETLQILDLEINKMSAKFLEKHDTEEDCINAAEKVLKCLDCSVILNCGKIMSVGTPKYNRTLSEFKYYLDGINDSGIRNNLLLKLKLLHMDNIIFDNKYFKELKQQEEINKNKKKNKTKKKKGWIKQITKDMFTGEEIYMYTNLKTGEIIKDTNPNLLETLNAKPVKKKVKKVYNFQDVYLKFK